jgi:hypothetical protein
MENDVKLRGGGNGAAVKQKHYGKEQDESRG